MSSSWFVRAGGKVHGPIDAPKLKQLVAEKKITAQTEVSQNHAGPWVPAGRVRGLFAQSPPAEPVSSAVSVGSAHSPNQVTAADARPIVATVAQPQRDEAEPFGSWYRRTVGRWNIAKQVLAWVFYGFFLIPLCWAFSRRAPIRARRIAWGIPAFMFAVLALGGIGAAVSGKIIERQATQTQSVDFARRGNRILLNELELKTETFVTESNRELTNGERIAFGVAGALGAIAALFFLFKVIGPGGESLHPATNDEPARPIA